METPCASTTRRASRRAARSSGPGVVVGDRGAQRCRPRRDWVLHAGLPDQRRHARRRRGVPPRVHERGRRHAHHGRPEAAEPMDPCTQVHGGLGHRRQAPAESRGVSLRPTRAHQSAIGPVGRAPRSNPAPVGGPSGSPSTARSPSAMADSFSTSRSLAWPRPGRLRPAHVVSSRRVPAPSTSRPTPHSRLRAASSRPSARRRPLHLLRSRVPERAAPAVGSTAAARSRSSTAARARRSPTRRTSSATESSTSAHAAIRRSSRNRTGEAASASTPGCGSTGRTTKHSSPRSRPIESSRTSCRPCISAELIRTSVYNDFSPRVAVAWDVTGRARTVVNASAARLCGTGNTSSARLQPTGQTRLVYWWNDANQDGDVQADELDVSRGPAATPSSNYDAFDPASVRSPATVDPRLRNHITDQFSAGFERQLAKQLAHPRHLHQAEHHFDPGDVSHQRRRLAGGLVDVRSRSAGRHHAARPAPIAGR